METKVILYTDGACSGNPGPGGWGCVLLCGDFQRYLSGFEKMTTNNRMEMMAVIKGLQCLTRPVVLKIVTDSQYVKNAFTQGWFDQWRRNNWRTSSKSPVKNQDLWLELYALLSKHQVEWEWVKGHSGDKYNEKCDTLARQAIGAKQGIDERV